ncbi:cobalamin biosynthesis protein CobW [Rhodobium gokarnense]|uniref:Cobalamin biosynthesis protein CobW n=1 Tax=Rhodobium gokarnense TaxID=364296 RepID=A0ABT3H6L0_9HYPH|nr:cobalamin biosynthesis protein CobW [Rhodobium gokarnense]MCW2306028.1 cobalamin biosynthesis protein CobW [Rhodobium gokarnense]
MKTIAERIPVTVITGFLGAGKTTLLRHVLENAGGRRFAVLVNEFGSVGVDGGLLQGCGLASCRDEDIVELANGCICCTVADDFLPTMQALLDRDEKPDHVLIETSGVALPKPLIKAFDWPDIRARMTVDGVIAVVDAPAVADGRFADDPDAVEAQRQADEMLDHDNPLNEVYEDQLMAADIILLNKADLLEPSEIERLTAQIAGEVPRAVKIVPTVSGQLDVDAVLGLAAAAEDDLDARPSHHDAVDGEHEHDDFESFIVELPELSAPEPLLERLKTVTGDHPILRVKGHAAVAGKPMRLTVQGVGERLQHHYDRPWPANDPRRGQLVVIGLSGLDRAAIETAIRG